jgi:hypothetical protein
VLIVGDGADGATTREAEALARGDRRVSFLPHPKGPRLGESHRNEVIRGSRGPIILYLSDDDLWLPRHVEEAIEALREADFVHHRVVVVGGDGALHVLPGHFAVPGVRERLYEDWNFVPLSSAGHTRALFDRLEGGWQTTPLGIPTDLFMWRRLLALPNVRAVGTRAPTVVVFPSPYRRDWSLERRLAELRHWAERVAAPGFEDRFREEVLEVAFRSLAEVDLVLAATRRERASLERAEAAAREEAETLCAQRQGLQQALAERADEVARLRAQLGGMQATATWRARQAALRVADAHPVVRRLVARVLGGFADRVRGSSSRG